MNKLIAVGFGLLAAVFFAALLQPQWNPITVILLVALILTCGWQAKKFWAKAS